MFQNLVVDNFQTHKSLEIEFDPITVITGKSDAGKSSILRALQWVCLNRPAGNSFISHTAKKSTVSLGVDNQSIKRCRSKGGENYYQLNGQPKFKAIGFSVPAEIQSLLRVGGENFQEQHALPFWLSLGDRDAAKALNELVDLESIDEVCGRSKKQLSRVKQSVFYLEESLSTTKTDLEKTNWVEAADEKLALIENRQRRLQKIDARERELSKCLRQIHQSEKTIGRLKQATSQEEANAQKLSDLRTTNRQIENLEKVVWGLLRPTIPVQEIKRLGKLQNKAKLINYSISELRALLKELAQVGERINRLRTAGGTHLLSKSCWSCEPQDQLDLGFPLCY